MAEYRQYCPVARAAEVLTDRWTPLVVRELLAGSRRFNEIERGLPGISRSLLVARLRRLEDAGVVERRAVAPQVVDYALTDAGQELRQVVETLGAWGSRWVFDGPRPQELDAGLLVWKMHQRVDFEQVPRGRTVVEFDFGGRGGRRVWLVLEPREASVCLRPPGFDPDVVVRVELALFQRIWLGDAEYAAAVREGRLVVDGPTALARDLPRWFKWSVMARFVRAARDARERAPARPRRGRRRSAARA